MSSRQIKLTVIIVTMLIVLNSTLSFAAPTIFTDINNHWGKEYIEDIYKRKITTGYPDGTFKPQGNITKLETIVIIAKLMGYSDSEEQYYINKYKQQLQSNNIPDWAQGTTAYALFNDILLEDELKSLVSKSSQTYAKRYEVATYIGRVLQYAASEELSKIYVIPYKDEMSIPNSAKPYIDLLLNKKILDKTSNEGRFLPDNEITRAEVAKLVSLSAKILDEVTQKPPSTPINNKKDIIEGTIDNIIFGTQNIISIKTRNDIHIYNIDFNANIIIDGKTANAKQLEEGQTATVTVEDEAITNIEAYSSLQKPKDELPKDEVLKDDQLEGYFYHYMLGDDPKVFIKDKRDEVHSLSLTVNSKVYVDGKSTSIKSLEQGDFVVVTYFNDKVEKIEAKPKEEIFKGIVKYKEEGGRREESTLEVLLDDKTTKTFVIPPKAILRRNRRTVDFEDIKIDDDVEIIMEYETVISVNTYGVRRIVEGYIRKIDIGSEIELTIEKYDKTKETFELTPDTKIWIEDERAGIYDLRLNYEVELEIENNEVIWVETYRKLQGSNYSGKVTYVDTRRGIMEIEIGAREEIEVHVDDDTIYNDEYGELIRLKDIYEGDEVVVVAEDNGYYFTAKRILVIIRR